MTRYNINWRITMRKLEIRKVKKVSGGCDCHCVHPGYGDVACGDSDSPQACNYHCSMNGWGFAGCR